MKFSIAGVVASATMAEAGVYAEFLDWLRRKPVVSIPKLTKVEKPSLTQECVDTDAYRMSLILSQDQIERMALNAKQDLVLSNAFGKYYVPKGTTFSFVSAGPFWSYMPRDTLQIEPMLTA